MDIPTAEEIRDRSNVIFAEYEYPLPEGSDADRLDDKIEEAVAQLFGILATQDVGIDLDAVEDPSTVSIMLKVIIRMLVEYNVASSQQEIVDTISDYDLVQSWSTGPLSETRRTISRNATVLHPWPDLNKLLEALLALANAGGSMELSLKVPVIDAVDALFPKPGAAYMYPERLQFPEGSIFGELRAPGVFYTWGNYGNGYGW